MLSGDMEDYGRPKGYPSQPQKHPHTDVAGTATNSSKEGSAGAITGQANSSGGRVKPTGANVKKVSARV